MNAPIDRSTAPNMPKMPNMPNMPNMDKLGTQQGGHPVSRYVGRYAPSPTGPLHFGSLVAAVASYLDARARGGLWHLRIEDIDETRCKPEHTDDIIQTLHTFGFRWDGEIVVQSNQKLRYEDALQKLISDQQVYACVCSRREIADSSVSNTRAIDGPVYAGTCRHAGHLFDGNALRVITHNTAITFEDRLQGKQSRNLEQEVGDFVLKRRDQLFAYQLAVVVDDHDLGVTDIVRGADLLDSTARQIHLQRLLGIATPQYLHIPVVMNNAGQKLSKQTLAPAIDCGEAIKQLNDCLRFLRQPCQVTAHSPEQLLGRAAQQWQPAAMPPAMRAHTMPEHTKPASPD